MFNMFMICRLTREGMSPCWHNWNKIIKDIYRVNNDNLQAHKRQEVALLAREFTQFSIFSRLLRVISMIMMITGEEELNI